MVAFTPYTQQRIGDMVLLTISIHFSVRWVNYYYLIFKAKDLVKQDSLFYKFYSLQEFTFCT